MAGPRAKAMEADLPWPPKSPDLPWPTVSPDPPLAPQFLVSSMFLPYTSLVPGGTVTVKDVPSRRGE